ncbi:hypothetical protein [Pseudoalteromonas rhizosphaerae]|uniref:hypothetical protein n=1 Tax=Pseudoalteromonas rhizosphaerae TaxID=2518973 RepID=UPI0012317C59|nr:hypothetical protein [Pseudoalteromonas rhizosphaerae]
MQDYATQINDLFNDDSYPPMIIFTGKWGIGKTYFAEKFLTFELKTKFQYKITYLSVLGITSLDDFKDLLIAKRYLEEKHDAKGVSHLTHLLATAEKVTGGSSIISNVIKGSAGAAKHYMLKNISDELFIIDDIERIECSSLKKHIIGECLTLTQSENKFIFVTDEQKLNLEQSFTEKTFSETIIFRQSPTELFLAIKPELKKLAKDEELIVTLIKENNLTNLRVLKRSLKRIESLILYLEQFSRIDYELTKSKIISDGIFIAKSFYVDNQEQITERDDKYYKAFSFRQHQNFFSYMTGKENNFENIFPESSLPQKDSHLDKLLYSQVFTLSEQDFEKGAEELKNYILNEQNVVVQKFFECFDYYEFLVSKGFLEEDERITFEKIDNIASSKQFENYEGMRSRTFVEEKYELELDRYLDSIYKDQRSQELTNLINEMGKSFKSSCLYTDAGYKTRPILHEIKIETLKQLVIGWEGRDIGYFAAFINGRVDFIGASRELEKEKEVTNELIIYLEEYQTSLPPSLKKGDIWFLLVALKKFQKSGE